jgi:2-polyprenyl-3-methyl-5-hydroxy-6-metoxy-1,4-benzoquinol methylase
MPSVKLKSKNIWRHCPACRRETDHRLLWSKNGSPVFRCMECGLGAARVADFNPESLYSGDFFNGRSGAGYVDYAGSEAILRAEFRSTIAALREVVPSGRLLEIGAAYGFFLLEAKPNYEVHGVEIADEAAASARARGLNVQTGSLDREVFERIGPVDVVVMLDVIEHLEDPFAALSLCSEFLREGGAVMLTTPDFASPLARLAGRTWRNMTPPQHLWYFTPDSLAKLAAAAGLTIESFTHPWKRVPVSLILDLIGRATGLKMPRSVLLRLNRVGVPVTLFDVMRVVLRKVPNGSVAASPMPAISASGIDRGAAAISQG